MTLRLQVAKVSLVKSDGASAAAGAGGATLLAQEARQARAARLNKVGSNWGRAQVRSCEESCQCGVFV
jgi:hypothetical protein